MLSLLEVLDKTTRFFAQKEVPKPRLQAELLMAHALGCKRLDLYLRFELPMQEPVLERLRPLVRRRANREPLQYILGSTPFHELTLGTDRRALVPRPETEELVEQVLASKPNPCTRILDLGTGTGAIALALAKAIPEAQVLAVDASADALSLARENAQRNGLENRVAFALGSWFEPVEGLFSIIVSNPPYLSEEEWASAAREVRDYEPRAALVAADGGLADLLLILDGAFPRLDTGGLLALETGIAHHSALATRAAAIGYSRHKSVPDLSGRDRFFVAWR